MSLKKLLKTFQSKDEDEIETSPVINMPTTYYGATKEEFEFWRDERNDTWKNAGQLIGKKIKLLEINKIEHAATTWGQYIIWCKKRIYDAEILCVSGDTVKFKTVHIDDGNRTSCNRRACLHDDQKYAIMNYGVELNK